MHSGINILSTFSLLLILFCSSVTITVNAQLELTPAPEPAGRGRGRWLAPAEFSPEEEAARIAHPDLFNKRDDGDATPSGTSTCPYSSYPNKRSLGEPQQVLTAEEMAAFLIGRGEFTHDNGTTYRDQQFAYVLGATARDNANAPKSWHRRAYNSVQDRLGNKLLEFSIPYYKKWKSKLRHDELVSVSGRTALRARDVSKLERLLLDNPDFIDIQVYGFRVDRRFMEVATSY